MTKPLRDWSPRARARLAGLFEALEGALFTYGQVFVLDKLTVSGNAAATAANLLAHESRLRLGFACCMVGILCHIVWAYLFYDLFRIVSRRVSQLALCVMLVGCAVQAVCTLLYLAPLLALRGPGAVSAAAAGAESAPALALALVGINELAFQIYLVFFGLWCFLSGWLIIKSTFLPRILGWLLAIDGIGWMLYVDPPFAVSVFTLIAIASAISELPLQLWLLIFGVNDQRWREQAAAAVPPS